MARIEYLSFKAARAFVRTLALPSAVEFRKWVSGKRPESGVKPAGIPANPHQVYRDEFAGYADFLGTGNIAPYRREWADFKTARTFVRELGLETSLQYSKYCKGEYTSLPPKPDWLPANPQLVYKTEGWAGQRDWLGTGDPVKPRRTNMRPFAKARVFARSLGLQSWGEWREYVEGKRRDLPPRPFDIPATPDACYRGEGWLSYADFIGGENRAWHSSEWKAFEDARNLVRMVGLRNQGDWRTWCVTNRPKDIPANPDKVFTAWISWKDWLGA